MKKLFLTALLALCSVSFSFGADDFAVCKATCKTAMFKAENECKQIQNCYSKKYKQEAQECKSNCSFQALNNVFNPCYRKCLMGK